MSNETPQNVTNFTESESTDILQPENLNGNKKPSSVVALLLFCFASILYGMYLYADKLTFKEIPQLDTYTATTTSDVAAGTPVLDITGKPIPGMNRNEPYYDFAPVLGKDHNLPFVGYPADGDFVFDQERNYMFRLYEGWTFATETPSLPSFFSNPRYTIKDTSNKCFVTLVERREDNPTVADYTQTMYMYGFASVSESQMQAARGIDTASYPGDPNAERNFEISPWRPYLENEFSDASAHRLLDEPLATTSSSLVLHAKDGEVITKECDEAFVGMLRTLEPWYRQKQLTMADEGEILFINVYPQEGSVWTANNIGGNFTHVLLDTKNGEASERVEIARLEGMMNSQSPIIYKNTLYYSKQNVGLVAYNFFDNTEKAIIENAHAISENNISKETTVNDYFVANNTLYTLQGEWCNSHSADCDVRLVASNLDGTNQTALANNIPFRDIIGFDKTEKRLYLRYIDGDAGCMWGKYGAYDYTTNTILELQDVSGCYDTTDEIPSGALYMEALAERFEPQVRTVFRFNLFDGSITPIVEDISWNGYTSKTGERIRYIY